MGTTPLLLKGAGKALDIIQALAMGQLVDSSITVGRVKGYKATSATSAQAIYQSTYTEQSANAQRSTKSASASDAAAGTGARTMRLTYLTSAFVLATEDITMNGTTPVATVASDICYVESYKVLTAGSTGSNVGAITFHSNNSGGATTIATMAATDLELWYAHHYVPAGKTCYLLSMNASSTVVAGQAHVAAIDKSATTNPNYALCAKQAHAVGAPATIQFKDDVVLEVAAQSLITLVDTPAAVTASVVNGGFTYVQF